jgi:predicted enzyme related to lactoylglutathione lyase
MGNPFVHIEYSADDPAAAKKFYKKVFDWKITDVPGMGGWAGVQTGGTGGGMGPKQDPRESTGWTAYAQVDSVKRTMAKAAKAGATVVVPYMQVGDMGALGIFIDPQGAKLGVWEQSKKPAAKKGAAKKGAAKKGAAKKAPARKAAKKTSKR